MNCYTMIHVTSCFKLYLKHGVTRGTLFAIFPVFLRPLYGQVSGWKCFNWLSLWCCSPPFIRFYSVIGCGAWVKYRRCHIRFKSIVLLYDYLLQLWVIKFVILSPLKAPKFTTSNVWKIFNYWKSFSWKWNTNYTFFNYKNKL